MTHAAALTARLAAQVAQVKACTTCAEVGKAYEQIVGYDSHLEDPDASFDDLVDLALGVITEDCYANGIHVTAVGIDREA
jgi:hypothetical protein